MKAIRARSPPRAATRRRRWWWIAGLLGGGLLLVLGAALPRLVAWQLERRLGERLSASVSIEDASLELASPGLVFEGIRCRSPPQIECDVARVEIQWSWPTPWDEPPDLVVHAPQLRLQLDPRQPLRRPSRPATLEGFRSVRVVDGHVALAVLTDHGVAELPIGALEAELVNTAWPSSDLTAHLTASATVGTHGTLELDGSLVPSAPTRGWAARFTVDGIDLVPLNPLLRSILEMDASRGTVRLKGRLVRSLGRIRGTVEPRCEALIFRDVNGSERHPMGEALFSQMLAGADGVIEVDVPVGDASAPSLAELMDADWERNIAGIIRRGYQRRLDTLEGYTSSIGGVEVDFSEGRLVLSDIAIHRDPGQVGIPFIHVPELEVVFDESVVDRDVTSYKHVTIRRPSLTFVNDPVEARRQMAFDPQWPQKVSALPIETASLLVDDGTIRFIERDGSHANEIALTDVWIRGSNIARSLSPPGERRAVIVASGTALGVSEARVRAVYEPASKGNNLHLSMALSPLPLVRLNPLARAHAAVDASQGTFGFDAELDASQGSVYATLVPRFDQPRLIGEHETDIDHPLREFMLTTRLQRLDGMQLETTFERDHSVGLFNQLGMGLLGALIDAR